ncbi:AAA family ATPase [Streptomyces sp. NPDC010273]|uniref:AAA family ATPase n=1 Tax=Streptomyces sp. NPDC010273 TaxID=3364829 RepID=UPI0036EACC94
MGVDPLPPAFASWAERKLRFYPKNVHMVSGKPGSFKTMLALNAIVNMGLPTLGFSNDSDDLTVFGRLLAIDTGKDAEAMEEWISTEPEAASAALKKFDFINWNFLANPTMDDVWLEAYAHHETEGQWPKVIVIDILKNLQMDSGKDEWGDLREVMLQSLVLSRETEAAVILVHHCTDASRQTVPTRADVLGKVSALPALMVNVGMDSQGQMWAAGVKVRKGRSDPDARDAFRMSVQPECARVGDYVPPVPTAWAWSPGEEEWG